MNWSLVFTAQAKKDAKKLASSGLKAQAQRLLDVLAANSYQTPPRYEKLGRRSGGGVLPTNQHSASSRVSGFGWRQSGEGHPHVDPLRMTQPWRQGEHRITEDHSPVGF